MSERPADVTWTAREALACALCWAEFYHPEKRTDSPEAYWLSVTERTRNDCRRIANQRLLLAVARGEAVPVLPSSAKTDAQIAAVGEGMQIKARHRIYRAVDAVYRAFAKAPPHA